MNRSIAYLSIVICIIITNYAYSQDAKDKSKTQSALCTAQSETFKEVFEKVYEQQAKVDANEVYKDAITEKTAECLAADLILWGKQVISDAQNGKFKRYRLSFEKPTDNKFKVPAKAKRNYKKAFKKAKRDFISTRKNKTLDEILDDKNLSKYLARTNKAFIKQKDRYLKKITR